MGTVLLILMLAAVSYGISLHVHPMTKCRRCDGKARHRGAVFTYATRACRKCEGTGRVPRLGVRLFMDPTGKK